MPEHFHLYCGLGDPWSHRVLIVRALKQLQDIVPLIIVDPIITECGWKISQAIDEHNSSNSDYDALYEMYLETDPLFTGRVTVPLLWDSECKKIINNASQDIMRILNSEFNEFSKSNLDLYPTKLVDEIDRVNDYVLDNINNGVYKIGFTRSQHHYQQALDNLFEALDEIEQRLGYSHYLIGNEITEADIRLFVTLVRFDTIYHPYLKCNKKRLQDYHNLWAYTREIYQLPGVRETVNFDYMLKTYYGLNYLNPSQIIPNRPAIDFDADVKTVEYELYSAPF